MTIYQRTKLLQYFERYCRQRGVTRGIAVTPAMLFDYQRYLCGYRCRNGRPLTIGTQGNWLGAVLALFRWLAVEKLIPDDPTHNIRRPRDGVRLPKAVLTLSEAEAVLGLPDTATPLGLRDRAILEVLFATGLRRLELCRLDLQHVDIQHGWVRVDQGKGRKDRVVPISRRAVRWLMRYVNHARSKLAATPDDGALFLSAGGRRISPGTLTARVHDLLSASGIGKIGGCHVFRHTFATLLVENGCDIRYVQEMLGHSDLSTTALYTHLCPMATKAAYERCHPAAR